jgi:hypothetical protein
MKYIMNVEIEAEQFLPYEDKIPAGVQSDSTSDPRKDPRSGWYLKNSGGAVYINDGDYVITMPDGDRYLMAADLFEKTYKPSEG